MQGCRIERLESAPDLQRGGRVVRGGVGHLDRAIERSIGVRLGEKLGWPTDRVERLRGEVRAYTESTAESGVAGPPGACVGTARLLEGLARNVRLGEVGALREWVARSEKKPEEFIRAEREAQARGVAEAAAATAASAPSAAR